MTRRLDKRFIRAALRRAAPWLLVALTGSLLFAVFGTVPTRLDTSGVGDAGWSLPGAADDGTALAEAEAVWSGRHPWGGAPPPPELAGEAITASAVPVAVVSTSQGHEAVFLVPGEAEIHLRAGDALPGGGRVESVDALVIRWTDARGQRQIQGLISETPRQAGE